MNPYRDTIHFIFPPSIAETTIIHVAIRDGYDPLSIKSKKDLIEGILALSEEYVVLRNLWKGLTPLSGLFNLITPALLTL